jgi:hypothetical protein
MSQMMMTLLDMVAISGLQVPDRLFRRSSLRGVIGESSTPSAWDCGANRGPVMPLAVQRGTLARQFRLRAVSTGWDAPAAKQRVSPCFKKQNPASLALTGLLKASAKWVLSNI